MADEVIRRDVVELEFDVKTDPLEKVNKELDKIKSILAKALGKDSFDDFGDSAEDAGKSVDKIGDSLNKIKTNPLKKLKDHLNDTDTKAGKAFASLKNMASVSFDKLKSGLKSVGSSLGTITKKAAKFAAVGIGGAAVGIGTVVAQATSAFADFEQNIGGVQKLFGTGGKDLNAYAESLGKPVDKVKAQFDKLKGAESDVIKNAQNSFMLGFSANQYMETVTGFSASLISDLGGDTKKAADLANVAIKDMADNANVFGTDMASVQQVYQGLAKNQYVLLDNLKLGYGGSKEGAQQLVKDAAKIDKSIKKNDLSFSNMVKAINVIQKDMGILGATEAEAAGTITGSLNATKAAWGNLLIAIGSGEHLDIAFENLKTGATNLIRNLKPVIKRALEGIGELIVDIAPEIEKALPVLTKEILPPLITASASVVAGIIKALPSIMGALIKEIPNVVKILVNAIVDAFGEQFPALKKIGSVFVDVASSIGKVLVPSIIGAVAAFKLFKGVSFITSLFGKKKKGGKGGLFDGITKSLTKLGKTKTSIIAKGMANLAIIVGGFALLTMACTGILMLTSKFGDASTMLKMVGIMGALGLVGAALAKATGLIGNIPIMTTLKGLANIGLVVAGMSALYLLIGAVSLINFDLNRILQISIIIGVLGTLGAALAGFAGLVGLIPIPVVLQGLANIGLVIGGMTLLIAAYAGLSKIKGFNEFITKGGEVLSNLFGQIGKIAGSLIGGLGEGITNSLPKIGENLAGFAESIKPMFTMFQGVDMGGLGSFFSAIGGFILKMSGSKILEFFGGGADFSGVAKGLTALNTEGVKKFFAMVNELPAEAFTKAKKFFVVVDEVSRLPNAGGMAQWFSGKNDFSGVAKGLKSLATEGVKSFFTMVQGLNADAFEKGTQFFKCLDGISALPNTGGIGQLFSGKNDFSGVASGLASLATEGVKNFFTMVQGIKAVAFTNTKKLWGAIKDAGTVSSVNITGLANKGTALAEFMKNVRGAFSTDIGKVVDTSISHIVKSISELPKKMAKGIKGNGNVLADAFVSIWKNTVNAVKSPVNKLISGANWVLKEFGSKKVVASWTPYKKGTHGHTGGNALVNDGRGAEIVQMPNGNTFIPQGKNVFIPNAPKGMKVLPAEQTAQLMGKKSPTYRYANGTGNIDIWSFMDNPKGLIGAIKSKYVSYNGLSGMASHIGKGMVETISGEMTSWAEKLYDEFGIGKGWLFPSIYRRISSYFGKRKAPKKGASTNHAGIDIGAPYGSSVLASKGGKISIAGWSGGYGNLVEIDHGQGWKTRYGHNSSLLVSAGQRVKQGQTIALVGSTGVSTGPHIHFEIRRNGVAMNPLPLLNGYANGGIATRPSIFGEDGAEMAIPLSRERRDRALSLWKKTGRMLGYTPEDSVSGSRSHSGMTENNSYAPVFNFYVNGSVDDRATARKLKKQVKEAVYEVFESMGRRDPSLQAT